MHERMNECTPELFTLSSGGQYSDVSINTSSGNSLSVKMSAKDRVTRKLQGLFLGSLSETKTPNNSFSRPHFGRVSGPCDPQGWTYSSGNGWLHSGPLGSRASQRSLHLQKGWRSAILFNRASGNLSGNSTAMNTSLSPCYLFLHPFIHCAKRSSRSTYKVPDVTAEIKE